MLLPVRAKIGQLVTSFSDIGQENRGRAAAQLLVLEAATPHEHILLGDYVGDLLNSDLGKHRSKGPAQPYCPGR